MSWQLEAACRPEDTDLFFSSSTKKIAQAIAICNTCSVRSDCLTYAVDFGVEHGIFGGLTPEQRKELVRS